MSSSNAANKCSLDKLKEEVVASQLSVQNITNALRSEEAAHAQSKLQHTEEVNRYLQLFLKLCQMYSTIKKRIYSALNFKFLQVRILMFLILHRFCLE